MMRASRTGMRCTSRHHTTALVACWVLVLVLVSFAAAVEASRQPPSTKASAAAITGCDLKQGTSSSRPGDSGKATGRDLSSSSTAKRAAGKAPKKQQGSTRVDGNESDGKVSGHYASVGTGRAPAPSGQQRENRLCTHGPTASAQH